MKFSIRDLLLVTVIVALALGWWIDHRQQAERAGRAEERFSTLLSIVEQDGYKVDWELKEDVELHMTVEHPIPSGPRNHSVPGPILPKDETLKAGE